MYFLKWKIDLHSFFMEHWLATFHLDKQLSKLLCIFFLVGIITACGGSGGSSANGVTTATCSIGGNVSGLASGAQVTLQNNTVDALTLNANGAFTFTTPVAYNGSYAVTISSQPAGQICSVASGTGSGSGVTNNVSNVNVSCSNSMGILVPLYIYPSTPASWSGIISAKQANPTVPVIAIVNPNSGPGSAIDPNYASAVAQLKAAGIIVYGYIHTSYGAVSIASLEAQMVQYQQWYGPSGMFFDEMANVTGFESYYTTLTLYANSLGMTTTIGNPGADTVPSYIGTVNTIVIYEGLGYPSPSFLSGGWHASYAPSNFAYIAYGVSSLDTSTELSNSQHVQYQYITNQGLPNPYNAFPSYFAPEVSALGL